MNVHVWKCYTQKPIEDSPGTQVRCEMVTLRSGGGGDYSILCVTTVIVVLKECCVCNMSFSSKSSHLKEPFKLKYNAIQVTSDAADVPESLAKRIIAEGK